MTRTVPTLLAALAIGSAAGAGSASLAHHGIADANNPSRVTLDRTAWEDGSARAKVRLVLPARVHDVKVKRHLTRRGRVVSFAVSWCHNGHLCDNRRDNR